MCQENTQGMVPDEGSCRPFLYKGWKLKHLWGNIHTAGEKKDIEIQLGFEPEF